MANPLLKTKLRIPLSRPELVSRPRLIERLDDGLRCKLTLVSARAGFGKTTLLGSWIHQGEIPAGRVSLDEGDNDPVRFLTYVGDTPMAMLPAPQLPPIESILTAAIYESSHASSPVRMASHHICAYILGQTDK